VVIAAKHRTLSIATRLRQRHIFPSQEMPSGRHGRNSLLTDVLREPRGVPMGLQTGPHDVWDKGRSLCPMPRGEGMPRRPLSTGYAVT